MSRPTLIYLHGFESSGRSRKASQMGDYLRQARPDIDYLTPTLPDTPLAAWQAIDALVTPLLGGQLAVLGSSLGGFWSTCLAARYALPAVVINPAVHPQQLLRHFIGQRQNPYTGQRYRLDESHIAELEALDPAAPDGRTRIWLLQQEGDEVLDYRVALDYYRACQITWEAGGNHAFIGFERHCAGIVEFLHL